MRNFVLCIQIRFVSTEKNYSHRLACILFIMSSNYPHLNLCYLHFHITLPRQYPHVFFAIIPLILFSAGSPMILSLLYPSPGVCTFWERRVLPHVNIPLLLVLYPSWSFLGPTSSQIRASPSFPFVF